MTAPARHVTSFFGAAPGGSTATGQGFGLSMRGESMDGTARVSPAGSSPLPADRGGRGVVRREPWGRLGTSSMMDG
jgi:hypothetical protein